MTKEKNFRFNKGSFLLQNTSGFTLPFDTLSVFLNSILEKYPKTSPKLLHETGKYYGQTLNFNWGKNTNATKVIEDINNIGLGFFRFVVFNTKKKFFILESSNELLDASYIKLYGTQANIPKDFMKGFFAEIFGKITNTDMSCKSQIKTLQGTKASIYTIEEIKL